MERQSSLNAHLPGDLPGDDFAGHVASIVQSPSREPLPGLDPVTGRRTSDDNMNTAFDDLLAGIPEGGGGEGGGGGGGGGVMRGQSALDRMPSIPADAGRFFDENDLMQLDGMLDFDVDADAAAGGFSHGAGGGNGGGNAPSYHTGGTSGGNGGGYTSGATSEGSPSHGGGGSSGGHGGGHGGGSEDYGDLAHGLDPKDPKYKRRIQNRLASARFRAKAKERQTELDRLKHQVTQLRREKFDLESQCARMNIAIQREGERQRTSTMAWIVDHFWLRRKVHFKTLANSVRWMVKGNYKPGMTETVLRAKEAADARRREAGESGPCAPEDAADASNARPSSSPAGGWRDAAAAASGDGDGDGMDVGREGEPPESPRSYLGGVLDKLDSFVRPWSR
jgi:hypothetical protein